MRKPIPHLLISLVVFVYVTQSANAQHAFLKKGTIALDPTNPTTLFLYVPSYTLLYDLHAETRHIRSRRSRTTTEYQLATTQDGVRVLIRRPDIRTDVDSLRGYDFLVNRKMPLCETIQSCSDVWSDFEDRDGEDGNDWSPLWPRVAGSFEPSSTANGSTHRVSVSVGGIDVLGYVPTHRHGTLIEDAGYITRLDREYPLYRFTEYVRPELSSPCGYQQKTSKKTTLLSGIGAHASASASLRAGSDSGKPISANLAKTVLSFLGLDALLTVEAVVTGNLEATSSKEGENVVVYGTRGEQWSVRSVTIGRRPFSATETLGDVYEDYGTMMVRTVLRCDAGQATEMTFASFLLAPYSAMNGEESEPIVLNLNPDTIERLQLPNDHLDKGLVSINTQRSHGKLIDFFLSEGIPKAIANFIIGEINVTKPR